MIGAPSRAYEYQLIALLCISYGLITYEHAAVGYLVPYILIDLHLSHSQVGFLITAYALAVSFSTLVLSTYADKTGRHKSLFVALMVAVALTSVLSGLAVSFATLLAARLLMGALGGPTLPLAQTIAVASTSPERRGLYLGLVQTVGSAILGLFLGPLLVSYVARTYGWRAGFFTVIVPGLIVAAIVARVVKPMNLRGGSDTSHGFQGIRQVFALFKYPNIPRCLIMHCCVVAYISINFGFMALYYTQERHYEPSEASFLLSLAGIALAVMGLAVPAISDRVGRKPALIVAWAISVVVPIVIVFFSGPITLLAAISFMGWTCVGTAALANGVIPSETLSANKAASGMGLIIAIGSVIGGMAGPPVAGWCADQWGMPMVLFVQAGAAVVGLLAACTITETAPGKRRVTSTT